MTGEKTAAQTHEDKLQHLQWAIKSRAANQLWSLRLLKLLNERAAEWKTKRYMKGAQDLVAVAFSLWRAAFLADKTGQRAEVFTHARDFLERLIEDNAIAYGQDKKSREWTFNYYTRHARSSLQVLHKFWPDVVPAYVNAKRTPAERWEYCQSLFEESVIGFERLLSSGKKQVIKPKPLRSERRPGAENEAS